MIMSQGESESKMHVYLALIAWSVYTSSFTREEGSGNIAPVLYNVPRVYKRERERERERESYVCERVYYVQAALEQVNKLGLDVDQLIDFCLFFSCSSSLLAGSCW